MDTDTPVTLRAKTLRGKPRYEEAVRLAMEAQRAAQQARTAMRKLKPDEQDAATWDATHRLTEPA